VADGRFEDWPAADRITWLVEEMDRAVLEGWNMGDDIALPAYVLNAWSDQLATLADDLQAAADWPTEPAVVLCAVRGHGRTASPCDRPSGHSGGHSWEVERYRRMALEMEQTAGLVPGLRRKVAQERTRRMTAQGELQRLKEGPQAHYGKQRPTPDRG
jgi:hypothetical protein